VPGPAHHAHFTDVAEGGAAGVVTNTVADDTTVSHLSYEFGATAATFYHTTQIAAGKTLVASYGLDVAPVSGSSSRTINATITGGAGAALQIGNAGENTADMIVGRSTNESAVPVRGDLDLSGLDSFVANLDELLVGYGYRWQERGTGTLTLAPDSTIDANRIEVGHGVGTGTLRLGQDTTIHADTIYVGYGKGGSSRIEFQGGLTNPTLTLTGLANAGADLFISHNTNQGTGSVTTEVVDLSGGTIDATLDELRLGHFTSTTGGSNGQLIIDAGTVSANSISMAVTAGGTPANTSGTLTLNGGTFVVHGPITDGLGTSTIDLNGGTLSIGYLPAGTREVDNYNQAAGATLELRLNAYGTGLLATDTATFASGAAVAVASEVPLGGSAAEQTTWTAGTGTWDDATHADWDNNLPAGFTVAGGTAYTFLTATTNLTDGGLGCATAGWGVTTTPGAGGSAVLTRTGGDITYGPIRAVIDDGAADVTRSADLTVAEATGADAAMVDLQDGSLTVNGNVTLGSGAASGVVAQTGGILTVNGSVLDGGDSELQIDHGDATVHGGLTVDQLRVGYNGGTASLTVDGGGAVTVGAAGDLLIGVRDDNVRSGSPTTRGVVDFSAAASVTLDLDSLRLATTNGVGCQGVLVLSTQTNAVTATTITLGDNPVTGNGSFDNSLILGTTNTIYTDTLYVGRRKSDGFLEFAAGLTNPTLTLRGADGTSRVNLLGIGHNDADTASSNNSVMDLSAGRVDALVNSMTIGRHMHSASGGGGTGNGTLVLSNDPGNVFDVNAILLGQATCTGSPTANGTISMGGGTFTVTNNIADGGGGSTLNIHGGTFTVGGDIGVDATHFSGGTLRAASVSDPGGAQFNWTGGTLHVGAFGLDLANTGTGTLAPGRSIGTTAIDGDYTQGADATLEIEIDGPLYDLVTVTGEAVLDGFLQLKFLGSPVVGMDYNLLIATGGITDNGMQLLYNDPTYIAYSIVDLAGGAQAVRLSYTPEPTTLTLLALGGLGLLARRRRRS